MSSRPKPICFTCPDSQPSWCRCIDEMPQAVPITMAGHHLRQPPTREPKMQTVTTHYKHRDLLMHELISEQLLSAPPHKSSPTDYRECAFRVVCTPWPQSRELPAPVTG